MYATTVAWFGARTVVGCAAIILVLVVMADAQDGCKIECYPNTKLIHGKGAKGDNCRWILRTDGKPARLCDHIKCKKVCPANQQQQVQDQQVSASNDSGARIEQQLEQDSPPVSSSSSSSSSGQQADQSMGIMRQLHGNKLAKAPVPGVAGGRLASQAGGQRRLAPTLPPSVADDENDTPPPISRFLDISPEE